MTLMRFDAFHDLDRWTEQALAGARTARTMPMEALRRGDTFMVAVDLPGVVREAIDDTVERNVVNIHATRRPLAEEGDEVIVDERPQGEFSRQLFLGENLDAARLTARLDEGVLTLEIPVSEPSKPRKVALEGHSGAAAAAGQ